MLLSLARGDIEFVRLAASTATGKTYMDQWRPSFRFPSGDLEQLIRAMWSDDYRQRPSMKDVVTRLEACVSLDDDTPGSDSSTSRQTNWARRKIKPALATFKSPSDFEEPGIMVMMQPNADDGDAAGAPEPLSYDALAGHAEAIRSLAQQRASTAAAAAHSPPPSLPRRRATHSL